MNEHRGGTTGSGARFRWYNEATVRVPAGLSVVTDWSYAMERRWS